MRQLLGECGVIHACGSLKAGVKECAVASLVAGLLKKCSVCTSYEISIHDVCMNLCNFLGMP